LYQHGLTENIQLAVVMSKIQFISLQTMQVISLKAGQTIEGIQTSRPTPIPSSNSPTTDLNAMDLSAFQHAGNISCGCSNGNKNSQGQQSLSSAQISELQAKINRI
ncbi:uncharacterized protein VP01_15318g1, partial [Puccinia sorghi]